MFCHSCGKELDNTARSCDACGAQTFVSRSTEDTKPTAKPVSAVGIRRNLLATIPAFFAFVFVVLASVLICLQTVFSVQNIETYAKEEVIPLLVDYNVIDFSATGIDDHDLQEIYQIGDIEETFTDAVLDVYENAVFDQDNRILTSKTLIKVLKNNADEIERITGYRLTSADYRTIETKFDDIGREKLVDIVDELGDKLDDFEEVLFLTTIPFLPYVLLLLAVGLFAVIFLIRRSTSSLIWCGAITLSGAIVPFSINVVASLLLKDFRGDIVIRKMLKPFVALIETDMNTITLVFAAAGVLLLASGIVMTIFKKRRHS